MGEKIHLWVEGITEIDDLAVRQATIEGPAKERMHLWYRLPAGYRSLLTESSDPFVVAVLFRAMREARDLVVHGMVSPSLLRNLEEFQAAWACWRPERYHRVAIIAEVEQESPRVSDSNAAVAAFSGGVDSSFTVFRHRTGRCGRLRRNLQAGLMVHGFDIPLEQSDTFRRAAEKSSKMLTSLGVRLIPMATNFRELGEDWEDVFAAATASCLMMLQRGYAVGLIGSGEPYHNLVLPWGSNPVTDGLLSSDAFQIVHDGAAFTRTEKVKEIAEWPEARQYLRVCWQGEQKDRNCGRCEKCIRTILNFRVAGLGLPECFERDVDDAQIMKLKNLNSPQLAEFDQILSAAKAASISESWVVALERSLHQNRLKANGRRSLRQRIRRTVLFKKTLPVRRRLWRLLGRSTTRGRTYIIEG